MEQQHRFRLLQNPLFKSKHVIRRGRKTYIYLKAGDIFVGTLEELGNHAFRFEDLGPVKEEEEMAQQEQKPSRSIRKPSRRVAA